MWFPTPSTESLTRPRVAVAVVSVVAAISAGYYAYRSSLPHLVLELPPGTLHRSNAVRGHHRRSRPSGTASSSSSDVAGDENAENAEVPPPPPPAEGEQGGVEENNDDEWWNDPNQLPPQRAGHNIVTLLFRVSEDNARRNGYVHRGCQCNACGMVPIRGIRYRCANCADFDLCETCESQGSHIKTHIFYKIRIPVPPFGHRQMQPVWYTGDPESCRRAVPRGIMARLSKETGFERPELEAFWEQWTYMANTEWRDDPDQFCIAMDRKTFERCLVPTGASAYAEPNLIHDRMFAFYDSNNDNLIGFSEFLHGLSYRRRKDKLQTVFDGYDIDNDGYVDRKDFLRMFKAYYVLYKQMHKDILDGLENQLLSTTEAKQLVQGRQPLSSHFGRDERVPQADSNLRFEGKTYHPDGHVDVERDKTDAFVENETDTAPRRDILTSLFACETDRRARRRLVIGHDGDGNWRTARRASGGDTDSTYWLTMLDPPNNLEQLTDVLRSISNGTEGDIALRDSADEDEGNEADDQGRDSNESETRAPTESEARAIAIERSRRQAPRLEKKRRDMARRKVHDRWRRRQFYLDEEEGCMAPDDWSDGEDILVQAAQAEMEEKLRRESRRKGAPVSALLEPGPDDFPFNTRRDETSHASLSAENDAGKEILYQVTQQAFNELLDVIFKPAEDLAVQAAETRPQRALYMNEINEVDPSEPDTEVDSEDGAEKTEGDKTSGDKSVDEKSPVESRVEGGYFAQPSEPRNAVELESGTSFAETLEAARTVEAETEYRDPTLPQNRPNSETWTEDPPAEAPPPEAPEPLPWHRPSVKTLRYWQRLELAELQAKDRGGWGKLNFAEFEEIYKSQEMQGNRLDYLGSWIDFCIP
ncbi:EF hand domain protein [Cordyceps fumosorosea ARSEF 2679]|uniref:EF hand domain protein n=1 Tax=Cordyceps fumosorosea (strain ARSEF 2679) TaxID=1081104 RepID=A0A167V5F8_CORFA|nr:EF hand domain protein [Cordyceps fumosorosea ARSEF 2679]OAA62245.1 EF hand domain protein [Cordyceps fumosorosea ARSEF 2679]